MSKTIQFTVPSTIEGQGIPTSARMYQSATIDGVRTLIETATLASLGYIGPPSEELVWVVAAASATDYSWFVLLSSVGIESQPVLLPPPSALPNETTIYVSTTDLSGVAEEGVKLTAKLIGSRIVLGGALISREAKDFLTDTNGYISFVVVRGASVSIDFPPLGAPKTVVTTGRAGIDLAQEP